MKFYHSGSGGLRWIKKTGGEGFALGDRIGVMPAFSGSVIESYEYPTFLDSGAFTLKTTAARYAKEHGTDPWAWYRTSEMRNFLDRYIEVLQVDAPALYANVDVMGNPDLTWRNQRYLERAGLTPVPVVHFGTDVSWVDRYAAKGYELIGLGGLVGATGKAAGWLKRCFAVTDSFHGFGIANWKLMLIHPWRSVDSAAAIKEAARGVVFIPHRRRGCFTATVPPYKLRVSGMPSKRKVHGSGPDFVESLSPAEKSVVTSWFNFIGVSSTEGKVIEELERYRANVLFFRWLIEQLENRNESNCQPQRRHGLDNGTGRSD